VGYVTNEQDGVVAKDSLIQNINEILRSLLFQNKPSIQTLFAADVNYPLRIAWASAFLKLLLFRNTFS
jgi:hypothetical protein